MDAEEADPSVEVLGRLLTAARAALFLESVENGGPELAVTVGAAADLLDESLGGSSTLAREGYESYRRARLDGEPPAADVVAALRPVVGRMPAYGGRVSPG